MRETEGSTRRSHNLFTGLMVYRPFLTQPPASQIAASHCPTYIQTSHRIRDLLLLMAQLLGPLHTHVRAPFALSQWTSRRPRPLHSSLSLPTSSLCLYSFVCPTLFFPAKPLAPPSVSSSSDTFSVKSF